MHCKNKNKKLAKMSRYLVIDCESHVLHQVRPLHFVT